jgi:hypothetical protein
MAAEVGVVVMVGVEVMVGVSVGVKVFVGLEVMVGVGVLVAKSVMPPLLKDITKMIIPITTSRIAAPPRINGNRCLRRLRYDSIVFEIVIELSRPFPFQTHRKVHRNGFATLFYLNLGVFASAINCA